MSAASVFTPRVILGWVAAVAATFALSIYLMAFGGGDMRRNVVGPSAFSRSAIGYAGLVELIGRVGIPVVKSRAGDASSGGPGKLLIVAEPPLGMAEEQGRFAFGRADRVLVILPKWQGVRSTSHSGWIADAVLLPTAVADQTIAKSGATGRTARAARPDSWTTNALGVPPQLDLRVQVIRDGNLRPIIAAGSQVLIGEKADRDRRIWILSDPDMLSNHGLLTARNAEFAIRLINALRPAQGEVVFDESVRGFRTPSANPLTLMFQFPLITVTIQVLAAAALLLWATMTRFGVPEPVSALLDSGKQGLIRNAANLLGYSGHPEIIVANYVRSIIRGVARQLRSPPGLDWQGSVEWLSRVGTSRGVAVDFPQLVRRAEDLATSRSANATALVDIARDTHRWKREILNGP
jgi:uncharacterized protein DUF4350